MFKTRLFDQILKLFMNIARDQQASQLIFGKNSIKFFTLSLKIYVEVPGLKKRKKIMHCKFTSSHHVLTEKLYIIKGLYALVTKM